MSSIYKQKESRFWWIKYRDPAGKIIRKSLRTPSKGVAEQIQKNMDKQAKAGSRPAMPKTLDEWAAKYLVQIKGSVGHHQQQNIKCCLKRLDEIAKSPADLTNNNIQDFIVGLNAEGKAAETVRSYYYCLSPFCRYLERRGAILVNPCFEIRLPKIRRLPPRYLRDDDYAKALEVAQANGIYLQVLTALKTGMRMTEIRNMEWKDVHFDQRLIVIPKTKSNQPRTVPLNAELADELQQAKKHTGPVFLGQKGGFVGDKQWKELLAPLQKAIPAFTANHKGTGTAWHFFRHTFGVRMAMAGVPLPKLKEWMGHRDIKTTMRYAQYSPNHYDSDIEKA